MEHPVNPTTLPLWKLLFRLTEGLRNYQLHHDRNKPRMDLTLSQVRIVGAIFLSDKGYMRSKELAKNLEMTTSGVSQLVEHLVQMGVLERNRDKLDKRHINIELSDYGLEMRERLDISFDGIMECLLEGVSAEERETFQRVLINMLECMDNLKH